MTKSSILMSCFFVLCFVMQGCALQTSHQETIPYKVNIDEAHALVRTGMGFEGKEEDLADISQSPDTYGFFIVRGRGKGSDQGEFINSDGIHHPVYETYAVNAWTGDVWTLGRCQRLSNPSLHVPLALIKARFSSTELKYYEQLRRVPAFQEWLNKVPDNKCLTDDYSDSGIASHESASFKVNATLVHKLAETAEHQNKDIGLSFYQTPDEDGFFVIDLYSSQSDGVAGRLAINAWTGDVWDVFSCKRVSNPTLRKMQADIKRRFSQSELTAYAHLHAQHARGVDLEMCGTSEH